MRPLIPRVRPGDILKGTRNLRNYLQVASTLTYLNDLSNGARPSKKDKAKDIYRPSKNERFLVTVNAWGVFGTYSLDTEVVLLFSNPLLPHHTGSERMNPTIFSKWFIRTPYKRTALVEWPYYAYYMRVALHLNMGNARSDNAPNYHFHTGVAGPFTMRDVSYAHHSRGSLNEFLRMWATRGATRATATHGRNCPSGGFGPRLEETADLHEQVRTLCSNPRIAERIKKEQSYAYQAIKIEQTYT